MCHTYTWVSHLHVCVTLTRGFGLGHVERVFVQLPPAAADHDDADDGEKEEEESEGDQHPPPRPPGHRRARLHPRPRRELARADLKHTDRSVTAQHFTLIMTY